ncbi:unnamed protein product [Closterium sp. NIES-65]|nr:unnamed protein product [Closterium sp. NIES-65]
MAAASAAGMGPPATVLQSTQNPPPYHPTPPLPPPPPREPREPEPAPAPPTPQIAMAAAGMGAPVTVFQSTQNPPPHHPSPPLPPPPPREPREPAPAPPTPQIAMAGMGAPVTVFAANFGSLKPRVLLIDGTCYASHAVVQRIARADRDQKLSFCCAQSETAHPYLAAFGLTPADVLLSPVYIQGYNASFSGTSGGFPSTTASSATSGGFLLFSESAFSTASDSISHPTFCSRRSTFKATTPPSLALQSEAAHPYLAAFGLNPSDVLLSLVYIQGFNASSSGTSAPHSVPPQVGYFFPLLCYEWPATCLSPNPSSPPSSFRTLLRVACNLPLPYPLLALLPVRRFKLNLNSLPLPPVPSSTPLLLFPGAASSTESGMGPASPLPPPRLPPPHPPTSPQHPLPLRLAAPPPRLQAGPSAILPSFPHSMPHKPLLPL